MTSYSLVWGIKHPPLPPLQLMHPHANKMRSLVTPSFLILSGCLECCNDWWWRWHFWIWFRWWWWRKVMKSRRLLHWNISHPHCRRHMILLSLQREWEWRAEKDQKHMWVTQLEQRNSAAREVGSWQLKDSILLKPGCFRILMKRWPVHSGAWTHVFRSPQESEESVSEDEIQLVLPQLKTWQH